MQYCGAAQARHTLQIHRIFNLLFMHWVDIQPSPDALDEILILDGKIGQLPLQKLQV